MPHSKDVGAYPAEFWGIASALAQDPAKPFRWGPMSRKAAHALRSRFNSFKVLVKQGGPDSAPLLSSAEFGVLVAMQVRIEPGLSGKQEKAHALDNCELVFEHIDFLPEMQALREALGQRVQGRRVDDAEYVEGAASSRLGPSTSLTVVTRMDAVESSVEAFLLGRGSAPLEERDSTKPQGPPAAPGFAPRPRLTYCDEHGLSEPCPICKEITRQ